MLKKKPLESQLQRKKILVAIENAILKATHSKDTAAVDTLVSALYTLANTEYKYDDDPIEE